MTANARTSCREDRKFRVLISMLLVFLIPRMADAANLMFFGDVLLSRGIEEMIAHEGIASLWKGTDSLFRQNTIRIANLEGAVGDKSSCAEAHIPCFSIKPSSLSALKSFDVIGLANNHSCDLGSNGLENSIRELKNRDIIPLGGSCFSTIIETESGNIAIVALTDVLNSGNDRASMAMTDSLEALNEIKGLRNKAGLVAVYVHWGKELDNLPTNRIKELAKNFVRAGADIVVGHHPHVVGKTECVEGKPVVYSLGNFLFDQKYEDTKKGAVLACETKKEDKLLCRLILTRTPMNSFVPSVSDDAAFQQENRILSSCTPHISQTWTEIFSDDRKMRRLVLKKDTDSLSHLELSDPESSEITWKSPPMPIVRLQPVDINADGISEIMLIQNVFSSLDNEIGKRVYVYSLSKGLRALWRGSALSRPLRDAVFAQNPDGLTPMLIALHFADTFLVRDPAKKGSIVMSYRWNGFGFSGIREKQVSLSASKISLVRGNVLLTDEGGMTVCEFPVGELR